MTIAMPSTRKNPPGSTGSLRRALLFLLRTLGALRPHRVGTLSYRWERIIPAGTIYTLPRALAYSPGPLPPNPLKSSETPACTGGGIYLLRVKSAFRSAGFLVSKAMPEAVLGGLTRTV